jgi:hypothetical protein
MIQLLFYTYNTPLFGFSGLDYGFDYENGIMVLRNISRRGTMTVYQGFAIFFLILFWTPSIIVIIKRMRFIRHANVVTAHVVNIEPHFRSAEYTFLIEHDDKKDYVSMYPHVRFQTFRMNESVELYHNSVDPKRLYYIKNSLFTLPIITIIISGFFALMFWIAGSH